MTPDAPDVAEMVAWYKRLLRAVASTIDKTPSGGFDTGGTALVPMTVSDMLYVRAIAERLRARGGA